MKAKLNKWWNLITSPHTYKRCTTSYLRLALGGIVFLILILAANITTAAASLKTMPSMTLHISMTLACLLVFALLSFKFTIPDKLQQWLRRCALLMLPILAILMAEIPNRLSFTGWTIEWLWNYTFYVFLYWVIYAISGSVKLPIFILNPIVWLLTVINYYVFTFRGTIFLLFDIAGANTAATVARSYDFTPNYQVVASTVLLILTIAIAAKVPRTKASSMKKMICRLSSGFIALLFFSLYFTDNTLAATGFVPNFYEQEESCTHFGVTMNFWMNLKYLSVSEPDNYSADNVEDQMMSLLGTVDTSNDSMEKQPTVVCIMNEALSDLSVRVNFATNKDYMPFLHSLTENTVKGNLYMPVYGNGTCNSEYEFLTGISTAFIPAGSKPYPNYLESDIPSLTKIFEANGYSSMAFHPYYKDNWNRPNVYNYMGFDKYYGMEDLFDDTVISLMDQEAPINNIKDAIAKSIADENILIRQYVSDAYDYQQVIQWYEESLNEESPLFLFNITMQNHGGYAATENLNEEIYIVDENGNKRNVGPWINQYLSLVYESDKAFESLIEYFEKQDEPVVICMFGDHQPELERFGKEDNLSIQERQAQYCTPFYIWANYDIEEKTIDKLSANYLGSYLMDILGMDMPVYNQYLLKLSETLPVIDTQGYIDKDGNYYTFEDESPYTQIIRDYECICYHYLFDVENRCDWLFSIQPKD